MHSHEPGIATVKKLLLSHRIPCYKAGIQSTELRWLLYSTHFLKIRSSVIFWWMMSVAYTNRKVGAV